MLGVWLQYGENAMATINKREMKVLYWELVIIASVAVFALLYRESRREVKYTVDGTPSGKYVVISYLDSANYGEFGSADQEKVLKRIRVPATALPWSTTVYLPKGTWARVSAENESGAPNQFDASFHISGVTNASPSVMRTVTLKKGTNYTNMVAGTIPF